MSQFNPIIIIPSRLGSTRLPNKPMLDIAGLPMIVQVVKRAQEADIAPILVAAAEKEILDCVKDYDIEGVLTDPNLASGSDRIYQALKVFDKEDKYNIVLNVQGDLPTIEKSCIVDCYDILKNYDFDISTLVAKITNEEEKNNPNVVKAILTFNNYSNNIGKALYFTRSCAPYGEGDLYHHIGIYGYKRASLEKFTSLRPSTLELREKLEQLRALENNMIIGAKISNTIPLGVDTKEDLLLANELLERK